VNDPLAFEFQASTPLGTFLTLYSAEPKCEFRLAKAGSHADSHVRAGDIKGTE
jgi:hypothetical protein